jgi:hypothetical protein
MCSYYWVSAEPLLELMRLSYTSFGRSWSTGTAVGRQDRGEIARGNGISGGVARIWAQRKMVFGTGGWDIQTIQQCSRINGNSSGGLSGDASCSSI